MNIASDSLKNRISRLADDVQAGRGNKATLVSAMASVEPWGDASWAPVWAGGWYAYGEISERASATFAERNPTISSAGTFAASMSSPSTATNNAYGYYAPSVSRAVQQLKDALEVPAWMKFVAVTGAVAALAFIVQPYVTPYLRRNGRRGR